MQNALAPTSNLLTPCPDTIPYSIWKGVHKANPLIISTLLNPLSKYGYHRLSLKSSNGVILAKPNKPDYSAPFTYHIIVLLQTFSKILKRIVVLHLAVIGAKATRLIHNHQCSLISGFSIGDAVTTLFYETIVVKPKVNTLFVDIKDSFNHILKQPLVNTMMNKNVLPYIMKCILSFLSDRFIAFPFKECPKSLLPHKLESNKDPQYHQYVFLSTSTSYTSTVRP